jgi:hypothetical protein
LARLPRAGQDHQLSFSVHAEGLACFLAGYVEGRAGQTLPGEVQGIGGNPLFQSRRHRRCHLKESVGWRGTVQPLMGPLKNVMVDEQADPSPRIVRRVTSQGGNDKPSLLPISDAGLVSIIDN